MSWSEIVFGSLLVAALVAVSLFFGRRQFVALRAAGSLPAEEQRYERRQARWRIVSCALTLLIALLIAGLLACYESTYGKVARERDGVDPAVPFTDEQLFLVRLYFGTWIGAMLVLLVVLALAGLDLWATRRYGLRQYRKIAGDRRAMIQRQATRLRQERNGHE